MRYYEQLVYLNTVIMEFILFVTMIVNLTILLKTGQTKYVASGNKID